jgi:ribosome maturation factor RimP
MIKDTINKLIQEAAESLGYSIYESSVYLKGENSRIVVKIDSTTAVSHKDCEEYSKRLSFLLDRDQLLPNYSLEISSPGFKRKLRNIEDFQRFTDSPVKIIAERNQEREVFKGKVVNVKGESITVETETGNVTIVFPDIIQANLDY